MILGLIALAGILLPHLSNNRHRRPSPQIQCVRNLKNIGLAFRIYATDNSDRFPMYLSPEDRSTEKYPYRVTRYFTMLSNELSTPKILICPSDTRLSADSLTNLNATNVSYFIGVDADETSPQMLLAGDRNITNGISLRRGILELFPVQPAGWTHLIHQSLGNVVLADGSVLQLNTSRLREQLANSGDATNRIVLPE